MGDLQKFIRQHFFDNHWTRDVDLATLSVDKLAGIDSAFCNIDVKSKLCLLLSLSSVKQGYSPEVERHVEGIFLQALDEENNLVKAVATILHSKQSLNYLNFDISPTNEAFKKNIEKLLKSSDDWKIVSTPLLSEFLGDNVLASVTEKPKSKRSSERLGDKGPVQPSSFVGQSLGFQCRGEPQSVNLRDVYLDRLKEECQRKRVHVPIPGRSFARSDDADGDLDVENSGFIGSQKPTSRPKSSIAGGPTWNRTPDHGRSIRKPSSAWLRPSAEAIDRPDERRPLMTSSEKLAARAPAAANCRKSSGIKLLNFDELPAFGPKAKQLRKEQMEKEREQKRQEREERAKELKAAREAAKLARQSERQTSMDARRLAPCSSSASNGSAIDVSFACTTTTMAGAAASTHSLSPMANNSTFHSIQPRIIRPAPFGLSMDPMRPQTMMYGMPMGVSNMSTSAAATGSMSFQFPSMNAAMTRANYPIQLLSAPSGMDEDEDDDDDHDEMLAMQDPTSGVYQLGISSGFRAFNPSARVSLNQTVTSNQTLMGQPTATSYTMQSVCNPAMAVSTATTGSIRPGMLTGPSTQPGSILLSSLRGASNQQISFVSPSLSNAQTNMPGTIKVLSSSHANPVVRIIQPNQLGSPQTTSMGLLPSESVSGMQNIAPSYTVSSASSGPNDQQSRLLLTHSTTGTPGVFVRTTPFIRPKNSAVVTPTTNCMAPTPLTPIRIAPRPQTNTGLIRMATTTTSSRIPNMNTHPVELHPRSSLMTSNPLRAQPVLSSPQMHMQSVQSVQSVTQATPQPTLPSTITSGNPPTTWMINGQQMILSPMLHGAQPQSPTRIGVLTTTPKAGMQSPPGSAFIQIMPHSSNAVLTTGGQQLFGVVQADPAGLHSPPLSGGTSMITQPVSLCDPGLSIQHGQLTGNTQSLVAASYPTGGGMMMPVEAPMESSAVKVQDDLCLTENQLNSVRNLFQGANRVSRPEKAIIVSFIAGDRGNPRPEAGNLVRIRLSEYRERVLNQANGQLMDMVADTYLHMDYATGTCEKVKYYRSEPPEVLLRLPVQPALH